MDDLGQNQLTKLNQNDRLKTLPYSAEILCDVTINEIQIRWTTNSTFSWRPPTTARGLRVLRDAIKCGSFCLIHSNQTTATDSQFMVHYIRWNWGLPVVENRLWLRPKNDRQKSFLTGPVRGPSYNWGTAIQKLKLINSAEKFWANFCPNILWVLYRAIVTRSRFP